MGSPQNLQDRGAGEMNAAAKMHGEPLAQLNTLTRWYLLTGLAFLTLLPVLLVFNRLAPGLATGTHSYLVLLGGAQLMLTGGFGIKFLPSSLGGNPHVYNLDMALWSYWFLVGGVLGYLLLDLLVFLMPGTVSITLILAALGIFFAGCCLLLYNLHKTMRSRV